MIQRFQTGDRVRFVRPGPAGVGWWGMNDQKGKVGHILSSKGDRVGEVYYGVVFEGEVRSWNVLDSMLDPAPRHVVDYNHDVYRVVSPTGYGFVLSAPPPSTPEQVAELLEGTLMVFGSASCFEVSVQGERSYVRLVSTPDSPCRPAVVSSTHV